MGWRMAVGDAKGGNQGRKRKRNVKRVTEARWMNKRDLES